MLCAVLGKPPYVVFSFERLHERNIRKAFQNERLSANWRLQRGAVLAAGDTNHQLRFVNAPVQTVSMDLFPLLYETAGLYLTLSDVFVAVSAHESTYS